MQRLILIFFHYLSMDRTAAFYSRPSYHFRGGGFPVFSGSRRMRGGSILGALKQMIVPTLTSVGKSVGRAALKQAVGFASDVANDALQGRNLKQSLKARGKQRALNVARTAKTRGFNAMRRAMNSSSQPSRKRRKAPISQTSKRRRVNKALF